MKLSDLYESLGSTLMRQGPNTLSQAGSSLGKEILKASGLGTSGIKTGAGIPELPASVPPVSSGEKGGTPGQPLRSGNQYATPKIKTPGAAGPGRDPPIYRGHGLRPRSPNLTPKYSAPIGLPDRPDVRIHT